MGDFDLVIRRGTVVDGSGVQPREADVAIVGGCIAEVGRVNGSGREEIDAKGLLVTPGFVDIHTHYDGQVTWENTLAPSSVHGVTTVLMGNCGVGFAPTLATEREALIDLMSGVEDIPEATLTAGIPFDWETFPEFLDSLERRHADVNFATQVPHGPVRLYVMGKRGAAREPATADDMARMAKIVRDGVAAGALGFTTHRSGAQRTKKGEIPPHETASEGELRTIVMALKDLGRGVIQGADDWADTHEEFSTELDMWSRLVRASGRPYSFALTQRTAQPELWRWLLEHVTNANREGIVIRGQVYPRPPGMLLGLDLSHHPFSACPTYKSDLAALPLERRVEEMRKPEVKRRLLAEDPDRSDRSSARETTWSRKIENMYELGDPPDYSPSRELKLTERAERMGLSPLELAYDLLVKDEGQTVLFFPINNFVAGTLDDALVMLKHPHTVLGIGDGGAHVGYICDASYPTHILTYWTRDRQGERLPLETAVKMLSNDTAKAVGLEDRGLIKRGYRADLNIIDYGKLTLHAPSAIFDLPAGGRRLRQPADGYAATIVNGVITYRDGKSTLTYPGRLIRGPQPSPN